MQQQLATVGREAERNLKTIGIPPCPMVLTTLVREMRVDEPDFTRVGKLLSGDIGLAAAMLKTVNSPFYGLTTKATSVQRALALLGLCNVAQLVTGLLLRQAFPATDNELMEQFWESSGSIAAIMAHLAPRFRGIDRDEAYTFGLFRDCGIPVMMLSYSDHAALYRQWHRKRNKSLIELEEAHLRNSHACVGYDLAQGWYLPDHACQAIRWHHDCSALNCDNGDVSPAAVLLIALGMLAEALYWTHCDSPHVVEWENCRPAVLARLGLSEDRFESLLAEVPAIVENP